MDKVEAVRLALVELGEVPAEEITAFVARQFGLQIDPRFLPLFKATLRDRENIELTRRTARESGQPTGVSASCAEKQGP